MASRLFFTTQAGATDTFLTYANPDGTGLVSQVADATPGSPWQETVIDAAENRYFIIQYDQLNENGVIYTGQLNSNAAPTVAFTFAAEDLVGGLEIDTVNNKLYVSRLDYSNDGNFTVQPATTGILEIDYNGATGALSNTSNFIVTQVSDPLPPGPNDPQGFILATDLARDDTDGTLYFSRTFAGAATNMIYRVDTSDNISQLLNQAQFPIDYSNGLITDVDVDASRNLVYFSTYSQPFGSDPNDHKIWVISDTATGSTNATAVTLVGMPGGSTFIPNDFTIDQATHQLYVESEENPGSGNSDDRIYRFQLSGDGLTATFLNIIDPPLTTNDSNIGGLEFVANTAPALDLDSNDSAGVAGAGYQATFTEGGDAVAIADTDTTISDDDANVVSATITLTNRQTGDVLSVSGGLPGGITTTGYNSGTGVLTLTGSATLAQYQTALRQIQFSNSSEDPNTVDRSITVTVNDGATNSNMATGTIHVTAVNDAPSGSDATIAFNQGASHTFGANDFGFSDVADGDTLKAVVITTLPAFGALTLSGGAVTAGQSIDAGQLGSLVYTPPASGFGAGYASFTFQVVDNGGTASGVDTDPTPNTITFNITPETTPPVIAFTEIGVTSQVQLSGTVTDMSAIPSMNVTKGAATLAAASVFGSTWSAFLAPFGPIDGTVGATAVDGPGNSGSAAISGVGTVKFGESGYSVVIAAAVLTSNAVIQAFGIGGNYLTLTGTNVDATGYSFTNWVASDRLDIVGAAGVANVLLGAPVPTNIFGGSLADVLQGGAANDYLNGGGGIDEMSGGGGVDRYIVDNQDDKVFEAANQGSDHVMTQVDYTLPAGQEIEILTPYSLTTTNAINLTGNEFPNRIGGNAGVNHIDGGAGADNMFGYGGSDSYVVDNILDRVNEPVGGGLDTVAAKVSWALTGGQEIEVLTAFDPLSTNPINLYGNEFANRIEGNAGVNRINGGGGVDNMFGYGSSDFYVVDDPLDVVNEAVGGGALDMIGARTDYVLASGQEVEILAVDDRSTTNAINLTGNEFANRMGGNAGVNEIDGGAGADVLFGYGGDDVFVFRKGQANGDTVYDFAGNGAAAGDSFKFIGYGAGATFTALDPTHWHITYNAGAAHEIITIANGAAIDVSDYFFS